MIPALLALGLLGAPALAERPPKDCEAAIQRQQEEIDTLRRELEALRKQLDPAPEAKPAPAPAPPLSSPRGSQVQAGTTVDEATSFGQDLLILGRVDGNATAFGGDVNIGSTGVVAGDAVSFGGRVRVEDGGQVHGSKVSTADGRAIGSLGDVSPDGLLDGLYRRLIFFLAFAGAGVLVVGLFPTRVGRIARTIQNHPLRSATMGGLLSAALVVLALVFAVLIIPLPLSLLIVAVLACAWLSGFVGLSQAIGDHLPIRQPHHGRWVAFLFGVLTITFISSVPLLGVLFIAAASLIGMGAALTSVFGSR